MIRYFIERAIRKKNIGREKANHFSRLDDVNTIVLLFNALDIRHIQKIKTALQKNGKQVILWGINYTDISFGHSQSTIIDHSELSFWGFPDKRYQIEFANLEADILVDMTREYSPALTLLMVSNRKIPVRIAFEGKKELLYDVICKISCEEHIDLMFKELLSTFQTWEH